MSTFSTQAQLPQEIQSYYPKCLVVKQQPKSFCKNYGFAESDNRINSKYKYNK